MLIVVLLTFLKPKIKTHFYYKEKLPSFHCNQRPSPVGQAFMGRILTVSTLLYTAGNVEAALAATQSTTDQPSSCDILQTLPNVPWERMQSYLQLAAIALHMNS